MRSAKLGLALLAGLAGCGPDAEGFQFRSDTFHLASGGDLQAAINAALPGSTIELAAGGVFSGSYRLPFKPGASEEWITIRTSTPDAVLPPGVRITPSQAGLLARIEAPYWTPAFYTEPAAHHYRLVGLEVTTLASAAGGSELVVLGASGAAQDTPEEVPHHLSIERSYLHGWPDMNFKRGVALNSAHTDILDSHLSEFHVIGQDSQAACGWNGPGPFRLINNHLEGAGENVMFGGAVAAIPGLVPSDIEIRGNHFWRPLSWRGGRWTIKNIFELKNGRRILVDGNLFENHWVQAQAGYAIVFTPRGQSGVNPWVTVEDVTFQNNVVQHSTHVFNLLGHDDGAPTERMKRIVIRNNLFADIGGPTWSGGHFMLVQGGPQGVVIDHNTIQHTANLITFSGEAMSGLVLTNNIAKHNAYGVFGNGTGYGNVALNRYAPGYVMRRNLLAGARASVYPPDNFYPPTLDGVFKPNTFELVDGSPYASAGTDGLALGATFDAPAPTPTEVVLYAGLAPQLHGRWQLEADASAAGGLRVRIPDAREATITEPLMSPGSYFELTFEALSGHNYHLWIRSRADASGAAYNDSVWVQFSDSTDVDGAAAYRTGTTSAIFYNLRDCSPASTSGWGWMDNGVYSTCNTNGPHIRFATSGTKTVRIQQREDGLAIDQVVLSPARYLSASPGALRNDNTILPVSP